MGLFSKAKAGISNMGNYTSQKLDETSINSKISEQKSIKKKALEEAGTLMFDAYKEGITEVTEEVKALFDKASECDAEVEKLEAEKAERIAQGETERQERRDAVKAEEEREKAEKAEKAEKEKQEVDDDYAKYQ